MRNNLELTPYALANILQSKRELRVKLREKRKDL
jgi:hypothetical protein